MQMTYNECFVSICRLKALSCLNSLWQIEHLFCSSTWWVFSCAVNVDLDEYLFVQTEHLKSIVKVYFKCISHLNDLALMVDSKNKPFDFLFEIGFACVFNMWVIKRFFRLNLLPHCSHVNPFSPVWWNKCDRSCVAWMKLLSQKLHAYGRSPVCVLLWRFNVSFAEKLFPHCSNKSNAIRKCNLVCAMAFLLTAWQVYGFSPVWDLRCFRSAPFDGNDLSHKSHENGFSPVWVRMWMLNKF